MTKKSNLVFDTERHRIYHPPMQHWSTVQVVNSSNPRVQKFVFENTDRPAVAEAVLYQFPTFKDRTVICCSTQSGCPVGCRFCGAGDNFVRSLSADEIVEQSEVLIESTGVDGNDMERLQIMFMSMGEPLLNQHNLIPAIERLHQLWPKAALLISTSAPRVTYDYIIGVSQDVPTVGLQFSVHESTDEARNLLIPWERKLTLAEIAHEGERWFYNVGRRPFFNYCVHERNDKDEDVARLRELFNPGIWECTVSVICERDETMAVAYERQRQLADDFVAKMMNANYSTRVFDPAGQDDIGGGCGQLWFVQQWMREHPELAKKSVGAGKGVVHAQLVEA